MHGNGKLFHSPEFFCKQDLFQLVRRDHANNQLITGRIVNQNGICRAARVHLLSRSEGGSKSCP